MYMFFFFLFNGTLNLTRDINSFLAVDTRISIIIFKSCLTLTKTSENTKNMSSIIAKYNKRTGHISQKIVENALRLHEFIF